MVGHRSGRGAGTYRGLELFLLAGLNRHLHRLTDDFTGHIGNHAGVVLTQPVAGKAVGSEQRESPIPESAALSRSNPSFEGRLAEVALKGLLNMTPKLTARQHCIS